MVKINMKLLPIKAHYFFFMAAMGPILPQISVYGKQLGISSEVMGYFTSILPILYVLAKPAIGMLADYFSNFRKLIFISLIILMTLCYAGFYIIPQPKSHLIEDQAKWNFSIIDYELNQCSSNDSFNHDMLCSNVKKIKCYSDTDIRVVDGFLALNYNGSLVKDLVSNRSFTICVKYPENFKDKTTVICEPNNISKPDCLYNTITFWLFVLFCSVGTIGFNVTNALSDAICFDVLENKETKYGAQRVWGTIGFGISALIAGFAVDLSSTEAIKSFTPALIIMVIFSGFDLISMTKLKLPRFASSESIFKDISNLLRKPSIILFLIFATLAGIIDSFIIYFMFWHLEEVAIATGYTEQIKLIEGLVVAAECLCGEIPMFLYSGKILKKLGYVHCLSFCFFTYSIRLGLISMIPNPWYLIPIEMIMQGCTYALCYTCIVAYASEIAPPGTSATVQGLVAGMDDGLGFAIGSLIGGLSLKYWGGARSFQYFAIGAMITCISHIILRPASRHETHKNKIEMTKVNSPIPNEHTNLTDYSKA